MIGIKPRYCIDGKNYYSVTQIIHIKPNPEIQRWRDNTPNAEQYMQDRATIGSIIHWRIQQLLSKKHNIPEQPLHFDNKGVFNHDFRNCHIYNCELCARKKTMVNAIDVIWSYFNDLEKEHAIVPTYLEKTVCHPQLNYAGTLDIYGYLDGHIFIGDWKTKRMLSKRDELEYGAQLYAYSHALSLNENFKEPESAIIIRIHESNGYELLPIKLEKDYFMDCLNDFMELIQSGTPP